MIETVGTLTTRVISDESKEHVYEIVRQFDNGGEEIIIVSLFPVLRFPNSFDRSSQALLNHSSDKGLKLSRIRFVFLFSKLSGAKISARELKEVDSINMDYLRKVISENPKAKIVLAFGVSYIKNATLLKAKVQLFEIIRVLRPKECLWQLAVEGAEDEIGDAPHILFLNSRYGAMNYEWYMRKYSVPYNYTPEGFEAYLKAKEENRERFLKNILGKTGELTTAENEEKPKKKGKK